MLQCAAEGILLVILVCIGVVDAGEKRIPNRLLLVMLAGVAFACLLQGQLRFWDRLLGSLLVCGILLFIRFLKTGAFGAGDIKLLAASGLYLGVGKNLVALAIGVLLAGAFCMAGIMMKKIDRESEIPFGPFLCAGIALSMYCGEALLRWFL